MNTERQAMMGQASKAPQEAAERAIRTPVDIFEDETGLTLHADMPGVSRERLDVHIDSDTLTIEGEAVISMPEGLDPLYADVNATHYRRSFSLSRELDGNRIEANLRDGVLTLRIPKREEHKRRKIKVRRG